MYLIITVTWMHVTLIIEMQMLINIFTLDQITSSDTSVKPESTGIRISLGQKYHEIDSFLIILH